LLPGDVPLRVEAALARLAGDALRTQASARLALRELPRDSDQGSSRFYAEWLGETLAWATAQKALPIS
jgi:hypothetical protein